MSAELVADFEKRFASSATIRAALRCPIERAGVTVLFGPSGGGKTTVLRCLAGLERPDSGRITFGDDMWYDAAQGVSVPPQQRGVGLLFQEYALFPHLTVAGNVGYGMDHRHAQNAKEQVREILARMRIEQLADRYPRHLSGGQQQRVALARTLACRPRLVLLDEPLSALDAQVREQLRGELRKLLFELAQPAIVVTHDRTEALALGDAVVVMIDGRTIQAGAVHDVFSHPRDPSVARVVGIETVVPGAILEVADGLATVQVGTAQLMAMSPAHPVRNVVVCIRGEDVILEREQVGQTSARNRLPARIVSRTAEGPMVRIGLECGFALTALVTRPACDELNLRIGETITVLIKAPAVHLVPHD
ncbi:MAG: ABC transporter ATP-binding protein [Planctomycetia bacterium]|nr:ABC transporter ATP-binding protein [Planctomycetia bacterium]